MFLPPQIKVYRGQIVGEHARENDLTVNPGKEKKLSNMRSSGADEAAVAGHALLIQVRHLLATLIGEPLASLSIIQASVDPCISCTDR